MSSLSSRIPGFYQLTPQERQEILERTLQQNQLEIKQKNPIQPQSKEELLRTKPNKQRKIKAQGHEKNSVPEETKEKTPELTLEVANQMIENVIGLYRLPLAIATNFQINGKDYLVPMCIEEPSVVAAASKAALLVRQGGGFFAEADPSWMIGQIFVTGVLNPPAAKAQVLKHKTTLLDIGNAAHPSLARRGGGVKEIEVRILTNELSQKPLKGKQRKLSSLPTKDSISSHKNAGIMVIHLLIDCCDAMGANLVNGIAEAVAPHIAKLTQGQIGMKILSNLADRRCVRVHCHIPPAALTTQEEDGAKWRDQIVLASQMAELDPYRAATHNKGIMNGVDAVTLATGNDWRGVEAGAHAFAARHGIYKPLSTWTVDSKGNLCGFLEMPLALGTKGGTLSVHPEAQDCLRILGVETASELGMVVASVGLATNLAALRALAGPGIQKAHMPLHNRHLV